VLPNDGTLAELERRTNAAWQELVQLEKAHPIG
jgi:hypothetical protein